MMFRVTNVAQPKRTSRGANHPYQCLCRRYGIDAHLKDVEGCRYQLSDVSTLSKYSSIDRV